MPNNFRNINFPVMLYETLTGFFSINLSGQASWLYKFCAACLSVLQPSFNAFQAFRTKEYIIANCKFQIGQLTNVLNYLYDPVQKRIYITQSTVGAVYFWKFAYPPSLFLSDFNSAPEAFLETFGSRVAVSTVSINVPAGIDLVDLTATVAQIAITGIPYQIVTV
jgi:hypothetical protein